MIYKTTFILLLSLFFFSCGKTNVGAIPSVPVNFSAPLSDPRLSKLLITGSGVTIDNYGVCGLIVYHSFKTGYVAFDRCSSYLPENKCAVTLDEAAFTAVDPCSGSKFSLDDGLPVKAPATRYLRSYSVSVYNNQIFITN